VVVRDLMVKRMLRIVCAAVLMLWAARECRATGSGIVWIPSTDVQPSGIVRFGIDNYFSVFKKGPASGGIAFPTDIGLTIGVLPQSFPVHVEAGFDLMEPQDSPWSVNMKAGISENMLFGGSPAAAVGIGSVGFKKDVTNYNIFYAVVSKILPVVGRLTGGYYSGNENILRDLDGLPNQYGVILGWDRAFPELSDNLVLAADYQDGVHAFGAFSIGATWNFTKDIGVMIGYNFYNDGYFPNTFTTQLDINI
jgi:hypothetical protein